MLCVVCWRKVPTGLFIHIWFIFQETRLHFGKFDNDDENDKNDQKKKKKEMA